MELMRGIAFVALLLSGAAVGAELRQAELCGDGTYHQAGYCPAVLSSTSCSATGATTGSCYAASDETDGTRYVCATSSATALTGSEIESCSGGTAIAGSSAAETGSNSVSLSGLTTDAAHYGQIVNESPEGWYSNRLVSSSFTPSDSGVAYDLSGFSIHFTVTQPTPPTTTSTCNVTAGSISSLRACVAQSNVQVSVPAGTYSGALTSWGSNVDIVMNNSATVVGAHEINGSTNIRWTGGSMTSTGAYALLLFNASDIILDNVNVTSTPSSGNEGISFRPFSGGTVRVAIVNSTLEINVGNGWGLLGDIDDLLLANVDFTNNSTGAAYRVNGERIVVVDSFMEQPDLGTAMRMSAATDIYWANIINRGVINTDYSQASSNTYDINNIRIDNLHVYRSVNNFLIQPNTIGYGTVENSEVHYTGGGSGTPGLGPLTDGGGNSIVSWDGSTIDYPDIPGKTARSSFGADH